ncbi:hypothetical protein HELRODRAFT_89090, partial [Helobdella robusta]|uniref:Uncharacterized protein n=1 Tax=Helobdella robusta TaxID=6412 RepID=T1G784_HELRO
SSVDVCRICHCEVDSQHPLISPCACSGTLKYVHQHCLQQWIKSANTKSCELCKLEFRMTATVKPFCKWQTLNMTKVERRKVICSVTFHVIAITCVVWSLYVLIERTSEEIKVGNLEWPFWTKLVVIGIGFTGGIVFMYIQCRMYSQLCTRWRAYNRVIYVQNCPDNVIISANRRRNNGNNNNINNNMNNNNNNVIGADEVLVPLSTSSKSSKRSDSPEVSLL